MEKKNIWRVAPALKDVVTITAEYAQEHFEELMDLVCKENIGIIVKDEKGSVVIFPYWWYQRALGIDPKQAMKTLFEESRSADFVEIVRYMTVAHGYIRLTTPESAREIVHELMPCVKEHPHAERWETMLGKLAAFWEIDHNPTLIAATHAGDRKVYLQFSDGQTRLLDMWRFIGRGVDAADLETEENIRMSLDMVTDALTWMSPEEKAPVVFFSEDLLQESEPIENDSIKDIWKAADPIYLDMLKTKLRQNGDNGEK